MREVAIIYKGSGPISSLHLTRSLNGQRSFIISEILLGYEQSWKARLAKKFCPAKKKYTAN